MIPTLIAYEARARWGSPRSIVNKQMIEVRARDKRVLRPPDEARSYLIKIYIIKYIKAFRGLYLGKSMKRLLQNV
jgi:hypothetical protein